MPTNRSINLVMILVIIRFILVFGIFLWGVFCTSQGFASITYTPGATIGMTGSNTDSRFDVNEVLYNTIGHTAYNPVLNTATRVFSWVFYVQALWWIEFNTGSYQVGLNCWAQSLSNLTSNCQLSWSGWSEIVGEINFRNIQYLPSTGTLSGSIQTYAGDFSLSGIYLPLKPAQLHQDVSKLAANTNLPLSISWSWGYAGILWELEYTPKINPFPQVLIGSSTGQFIADISYAEDYSVTITDPDGWTTVLDAIIHPGEVDIGGFDSSNNYIHQFCLAFPGSCPDGNTPIETTKIQTGNNIVADGNDSYQVTLKPRDRFGNRVLTGSVVIRYDTTVTSVQIPSDTIGPAWWTASFVGDAVIFSGEVLLPDVVNNRWETPTILMNGHDTFYTIASVVPTDASHQVVLKDIIFTKSDASKATITDGTPLAFLPAFDANITPPASIKIGEDSLFQVNTTKNTSLSFTPHIFSAFGIWNGANASFQNFQSANPINCEAHDNPMTGYVGTCDWIESQSFWYPSIASIHAISPSYSITGSYVLVTADPPEESVSYANYVHYKKINLWISLGYLGSDDIVYLNQSGNLGNSVWGESNLVILWQNNIKRHDGVRPNKSERASFMDTIRKNTAILSRNRTTYTDVPYTIHQGNLSVDAATITGKRALVVVGWDITLTANIPSQDTAMALVALTDAQGNGGNIIIDPSVSDIHASIIAEHSLLSSGDRQLYVHGSIITANTYGGTMANICPYYVKVACTQAEAKKHDMEKIRLYDGVDVSKKAAAPTSSKYPQKSVIIEYDMRVEQNPPPILK